MAKSKDAAKKPAAKKVAKVATKKVATKAAKPTKKVATKAVATKKPATKKPATKKAAKPAKQPATTKAEATKKAAKPTKQPAPKQPAPTKASARTPTPSAAFSSLAASLADNPGITVARMFGHQGLGLDRRFFAFDHDGELVVRLPPERVSELTAAGVGAPFDPGMGRPSKGWLSVPPGQGDWQRLAEEALAHVATMPPK